MLDKKRRSSEVKKREEKEEKSFPGSERRSGLESSSLDS
jgi:hypothetical protein